jgi:peptidyl-prolyl cis-trans isomerase D
VLEAKMLQNIRDNVQGTMAKVIVAIIIVPFAIFGVDTLINSGGPAPVAQVNGAELSQDELAQEIMLQKRQLMAMMGENIQPEMLEDDKLRGPSLDRLITRQLLQQAADTLKLRVSSTMVDDTIRSVPQFQEGGRFSPERYQQLLRDQGFSPAYYKQLLQRELVVDQMQTGLSESEFATAKEIDTVTGLLQQQRSFSWVVVPADDFVARVEVSDADIDSYYKANADRYQREERVKLEYIELRAADFANQVDDAAVQAEYDRFAAAFKPATQRHAAHILIEINDQRSETDALARAEEASRKLAGGAPFDKLVEEYSDDQGSKGNAGDIGVSSGDLFPTALESALAQLKPGEVSAPVKSDAGYHLVKLLGQSTESLPSFESKKDEIAQRLAMDGVQQKLVGAVEKLRDQVFNSDGLAAPAKSLQLTVRESDWVDRKSTDPLFGDARVRAAAFAKDVLAEGNNSDVIELTPEHYIVLRAKAHEPATPKPLDEVKAQVVAALKHERAIAAAQQLATKLQTGTEQGGDLITLAAKDGYKGQKVDNADRNGGQSPEVTRAAFGMARPAGDKASVLVKTLANGDAAVIHLHAVVAGASDSLNSEQKAGLASQLEQASGTATFAATMESLRKAAEIERY